MLEEQKAKSQLMKAAVPLVSMLTSEDDVSLRRYWAAGMADAIFLCAGRLYNGQRLRKPVVGSDTGQAKGHLPGHPVGWWVPVEVSQGLGGLPGAAVKACLNPSQEQGSPQPWGQGQAGMPARGWANRAGLAPQHRD